MSAPANNANGDAHNNAGEGAAGGAREQAGNASADDGKADNLLAGLLDMPAMVKETVERTLAQNSARAEGAASEARLRRMKNNHMRLVLGWAVKAWELGASDRQRLLHAFLEAAELLDEGGSVEQAAETANDALKSACKKLSLSKDEQDDLFEQLKIRPKTLTCERCGHASHAARDCYAKTDAQRGGGRDSAARQPDTRPSKFMRNAQGGRFGFEAIGPAYGGDVMQMQQQQQAMQMQQGMGAGAGFYPQMGFGPAAAFGRAPAAHVRCHNCQQFGHYARFCTAPKPAMQNGMGAVAPQVSTKMQQPLAQCDEGSAQRLSVSESFSHEPLAELCGAVNVLFARESETTLVGAEMALSYSTVPFGVCDSKAECPAPQDSESSSAGNVAVARAQTQICRVVSDAAKAAATEAENIIQDASSCEKQSDVARACAMSRALTKSDSASARVLELEQEAGDVAEDLIAALELTGMPERDVSLRSMIRAHFAGKKKWLADEAAASQTCDRCGKKGHSAGGCPDQVQSEERDSSSADRWVRRLMGAQPWSKEYSSGWREASS